MLGCALAFYKTTQENVSRSMRALAPYKQLPKAFWMLCLTTALFYSATHVFTTMIPLFMVSKGQGADASGQLLALFLIVSVITRPWVGKFYDETSPKVLFTAAIASFLTGTLLMLIFSEVIPMLWVARAFQGVGFSIFNASSYSCLTQTIPDELRGRGISLFSNAIKLAMAYAPGIGWLLGSQGYFIPAMGCSLLFITGAFFALQAVPFQRVQPKKVETTVEEAPKTKGKLFNVKGVIPGLLIASNSVVYGSLIPFVPLLVVSKGLTNVEGFHIFYALSLIASRFVGGEASDKLGRLYTIIPGMAVVGLSVLGMIFAQSTWQFLGATILYGLGSGVVQPSIVAMVADRTAAEERGSAMATYTMLADFGQASGMLLMGYMGTHHTYVTGLGAVGGLNLLGLLLAIILFVSSSRCWRKRTL